MWLWVAVRAIDLHAVGDAGARRSCAGGGKKKAVHAAALDSALFSLFPTPLNPKIA
jgi:hypothetical protein